MTTPNHRLNAELERSEDLLQAPSDERTLGAALLSFTTRHLADDLLNKIPAEAFADTHIGELWASAKRIRNRGETLSKRTLLAERDTPAIRVRVEQLAGEPISQMAALTAAQAVRDMAESRRLIQALKRIATATTTADNYSEAYEFAANQIAELAGGKIQNDVQPLHRIADQWLEWLDAPETQDHVTPTPWNDLNDVLAGGLHAGRTYIIGGRPGEGKSLAGLNLALHAAEQNHRTIVFSVEMGSNEVASRLFASGAHVEYGQITRRTLDAFNREKLEAYVAKNRDMPLYVVDKSDITIDYIAARCRALKRNGGLDVVFVDYLQLLKETDSKQTRERQVAQISRSLKILARELDCAIIIACQLNRSGAKDERKPTLADLRESGSIEQDADVVVLLHHEKEQDRPTGFVDLVVAKNRTGKTTSISLRWMSYQARLG